MTFPLRRSTLALSVVALLAPAASASADGALAGGAPVPGTAATIGIDEVERGQTGEGLSVFAGRQTAPFQVEVLGVLRDSTPELSYIIARLTGQDLERSGVIAGMSGSPVWIEGRLAGAVAFSYLFGLDAIAGITPIDAMRTLLPRPGVSGTGGAAGGPPSMPSPSAVGPVPAFTSLVEAVPELDLLDRHLASWSPAAVDGGTAAVAWAATGFGERALASLRRGLGEVAMTTLGGFVSTAGGGSAPRALLGGGLGDRGFDPAELDGGSPVAVVLVDGDLGLAAHGTVTERRGDEILAFGHPVFGFGPAPLPLATGEVVTIIANRFNSFKVSNAGRIVGAFEEDRQAGMWGRLGAEAPMIPVSIELEAERSRRYELRMADLPALSPSLFGISVLGALDAGSRLGGPQSLEVEADFDLGERGSLSVVQAFDGENAAGLAIAHLMGFAAWLEGNELETPPVERIDVRLRQFPEARSRTLVGGRPARREVAPGETVPITLDLRDWRGDVRTERVDVRVPPSAQEGRYILFLGEGPRMDGSRLGFERRRAWTFDQALEMLGGLHSRTDLVALGMQFQPGAALPGSSLPALPGSMRQVFSAPSQHPRAEAFPLVVVAEESFAFDRPLVGHVRVDLEIRRPRASR